MPDGAPERVPFIITIDTEGDDLWARPRAITTENAKYLPRFQDLCARFKFKPVYLTNYEMALSPTFVEFARDVVAHDAGEIGMHLHAWNSPPLTPLTDDDFRHQPYLIEYPEAVMRDKIKTLTALLEDRFDRKMLSHRAGRWAFDRRYAALLLEQGYRVDCSVTPGVDWSGTQGDPAGAGGTDYSAAPQRPYLFGPATRPCASGAATNDTLLEVPMTIRASALYRHARLAYRVPLLRRFANRAAPGLGWLCPVQPALRASVRRNLDAMLQVARDLRIEGSTHMEFMLHSSELMPNGSPNFRSAPDIERLYEYLETLFEELSSWCIGVTLTEFRARFDQVSAPERP